MSDPLFNPLCGTTPAPVFSFAPISSSTPTLLCGLALSTWPFSFLIPETFSTFWICHWLSQMPVWSGYPGPSASRRTSSSVCPIHWWLDHCHCTDRLRYVWRDLSPLNWTCGWTSEGRPCSCCASWERWGVCGSACCGWGWVCWCSCPIVYCPGEWCRWSPT